MKKLIIITPFLAASLTLGLEAADLSSYPTSYSLSEGKYVEVPSRHVKFPFYVYGDESGALSDFTPSGYMGDAQSLRTVTSAYDESAPASTGRTGKTTMRVDYKPKGRQGWAGLYWQTPANNWARIKGAGFNLTGARYLSFWARGEKGNELIAAAMVGGITGSYPDSDKISFGPFRLTQDWKQYKIDLSGRDLRHIIGGFAFLLRRPDNPAGATFYLDEIVYLGDADLDYFFGKAPSEKPSVSMEPAFALSTGSTKIPAEELEKQRATEKNQPVKIIYVEKPVVMRVAEPSPIIMEMFKPTHWDAFLDLLRRAMEVQPTPYGYDAPLYWYSKYLQERTAPSMAPALAQ